MAPSSQELEPPENPGRFILGGTDEVVGARVEVIAEYIRRIAQGEMLLNPVVP
jgi:hypothetical protein